MWTPGAGVCSLKLYLEKREWNIHMVEPPWNLWINEIRQFGRHLTWATAGGWSILIKSGVLPGDVVGESIHEQACPTHCIPLAATMVTMHKTFQGGEAKMLRLQNPASPPTLRLSNNRIHAEKMSDSTFYNSSRAFRCHWQLRKIKETLLWQFTQKPSFGKVAAFPGDLPV